MTDAPPIRCLFVGERPEPGRFVEPTMRVPPSVTGKPAGGLWTCREVPGQPSEWLTWCIVNEQTHLLSTAETWRLTAPSPRILAIDGEEGYLLALERYRHDPFGDPLLRRVFLALDFVRIAEEYDAVELTERGFDELRFAFPGLPGWDVPTILWLRWVFAAVERHVAGSVVRDVPDGPACGHIPARRQGSGPEPETPGGARCPLDPSG